MRWGHATRLPKPPYADSRRHSGVNASILARAPRGNRPPEWSTILAQGLLRPARRSQSCLHTPIRTPVSLHRNLLFAEVLRRPVESAPVRRGFSVEYGRLWNTGRIRPVKPGDDGWGMWRGRAPPLVAGVSLVLLSRKGAVREFGTAGAETNFGATPFCRRQSGRKIRTLTGNKNETFGRINETQDASRRNDRRRRIWADLGRCRSAAADQDRHEHGSNRRSRGRRQGLAAW